MPTQNIARYLPDTDLIWIMSPLKEKRIVPSGLYSPKTGSSALKPNLSSYVDYIHSCCKKSVKNRLEVSSNFIRAYESLAMGSIHLHEPRGVHS
jgi:hypothetical protein